MPPETSAGSPESQGAAEQSAELTQATGESTASATPAEESQGAKQSPLDIVKDALSADRAEREKTVSEQRKATETPSEAQGSDPTKTDAKAEAKADDKGDSKDDKQERNFRALREELAAFKERAERYDQLSGFLQESDLSAEDFATGLRIMRMMRQDPEKAYEALRPIVESLQATVGEKLPADVQDRLDRGLIDEESARELARERGRRALAASRAADGERRLREVSEAAQAEREQQARVEHAHRVGAAVSAWEKAWEGNDPDYKVKHRLVMDRVTALMQSEGIPASPEAAVAQAEKAKKDIDEWYASTVGSSRKPVSTVTGGAGNSTRSTPRTPADVARAALGMGQ